MARVSIYVKTKAHYIQKKSYRRSFHVYILLLYGLGTGTDAYWGWKYRSGNLFPYWSNL